MSSSTKRKSPQGTSISQDTESTQSPTHTPSPKCLHTLLAIKDWSIVELLGNRKAPPNTRASGDDVMDGAYSKEQGGTGEAILVDSPMAAAASTLLYHLQFCGDDVPDHLEASNGKQASDSGTLNHSCASLDDNIDYKPDGLVFSDDTYFLIDIDSDWGDEQL